MLFVISKTLYNELAFESVHTISPVHFTKWFDLNLSFYVSELEDGRRWVGGGGVVMELHVLLQNCSRKKIELKILYSLIKMNLIHVCVLIYWTGSLYLK